MVKEAILIRSNSDAVKVLGKWRNKRQENFLAITLNGNYKVIKIHHITKGLVNKTIVHPRECFYPVIKDYASAVIFAHNHPSGDVTPSNEDKDIAERLNRAGVILGITVLDHLIICPSGDFYSFRHNGDIKDTYDDVDLDVFIANIKIDRYFNGGKDE